MSEKLFDVNNTLSRRAGTLTLHINDEETEVYTLVGVIAEGAYGDVFAYSGEQGDVAVKRVDKADPELAIVTLLEKSRGCNVVRARRIACEKCTSAYIAMERMDGNLYGRRYDQAAVIRIVRQLQQQLRCLANIRADRPLLYTDLKTSNILYRDYATGGYSVRLGDLGSAGMYNDDKYITTYPFLQREYEWPEADSLPMQRFHEIPLDHARDCVAYQLAGVALYLVSGEIIKIRASGEVYTREDEARAQTLRTKCAHLLRQYFPCEPYGDWLSLDPTALAEFWTTDNTARTASANDVTSLFKGRYRVWPVVAAIWCATQYASDADLLDYTTGVLRVVCQRGGTALYKHISWYDASYHADKGFLPEIRPDDEVNTETVVTNDPGGFVRDAIAREANRVEPFDWTYFIAHHLQLHPSADVSSMLAIFPSAILQRVCTLCERGFRELQSPTPYRALTDAR
jgi:hypothetical protein